MWEKVLKTIAGIGGAAAGLLGEWNMLLTILAVLMVMDYATGVVVACCGKSPKSETGGVSSKAGFDGLLRKGFIIVIVLLATVLDRAIGNGSMVFQTACTCYYIANEGVSIVENAVLMDVPVPGAIQRALEIFRKRGELEDKDDMDK
jgi:toxin secretion/phage lysis holin